MYLYSVLVCMIVCVCPKACSSACVFVCEYLVVIQCVSEVVLELQGPQCVLQLSQEGLLLARERSEEAHV